MIVAYAPESVEFESNGLGVLDPTSCEVSETLNGAFELTLTHPIDENGKWEELVDGVVIKVPCPTASVPPVTFQMVPYGMWSFSLASNIYTLTFDGNGSVTSAEMIGTLEGGSWFKVRNEAETITYNGADYIERIESYTETTITYVWQRLPDGGTQSAMTGDTIYLQSSDTENAEYLSQGQITSQLFRIYRTVKELDIIQARASHIFYDLRHDPGPRTGDARLLLSTPLAPSGAVCMYTLGGSITMPGYTATSNIQTMPKKVAPAYLSTDNTYVGVLLGKDGLCELYEGELWRNNKQIGLFSRLGQDTPVVIRDGKNLTGLKIDANSEKVVTRVFPYGKDANGIVRELSFFDNTKEDNVDSTHIDDYPFPRTQSFMVDDADMTQSGTTAAIAAGLMLDAAQKKYTEEHIDEPEITVDVNFELIEYLDEYEAVKELERVFIGDGVRVISERLGVDMQVRVNSYVFDCLAIRYKKLSMESNMRRDGLLGTFERYITDSLAGG